MPDKIFELEEDQVEKLDAWKKEQKIKIDGIKERQADPSNMFLLPQEKYSGSGDSYTYKFTPTGIGLSIIVVNNLTEDTLDLSDYDKW